MLLPSAEHLLNQRLLRDPRDRAAELSALLESDEVDGVIAGWGGKSCNELLSHIDFALLRDARKPILGFSDTGVLLNAIWMACGLVSFYGPNVLGKLDQPSYLRWDLLTDPEAFTHVPIMSCAQDSAPVQADFSGVLVGGNLSTFVIGLSGTPWLPRRPLLPRVFFYESTESLDVQRQLLSALRNQGFFDGVSGVVVGQAERANQRWGVTADETLRGFLLDMNIPVVFADCFGHSTVWNPIFPIGAAVRVHAGRRTVVMYAREQLVEQTIA